jgi:protocatechuate 3,4-dioxygenase beta subunit
MKVLLLACIAALAALSLILTHTPTAEAATITITIQDYHGNPLPSANVSLSNSSGTFSASTNSNGIATLNNMNTTIPYNLTITYLGIIVREFTNWIPGSSNIFRTGVFNVRICVQSWGGVQPVQGAIVRVRSTQTTPQKDDTQQTGSDGCATFPRLPGNSTVYTYNATYNHQVFQLQISNSTTVNLTENNYNNNNIILRLYRLRLTLQDREGRPVQGLQALLWRGEKSGQAHLTATSDQNGVAVFSLLPQGTYIYEVVYRGDTIYSVDPPEIVGNNRDRGPIKLPLTSLTLEVYDLKNKPLTSYTKNYQLVARLYVDARLYLETSEDSGVISMGYVYDERDYRLTLLFEGQEVANSVLQSDDVQAGTVRVQARFGDFTITLDSAGFFGNLPKIISQKSSVRLSVGGYQITEPFSGGNTVTFRDHPIVRYNYTIILDGLVIGEGGLTPAHGESSRVRPSSYTVSARASSLDDKPVAGVLKILYRGEALGTVDVAREGGRIEGLARLPYRYSFAYMGVEVASGDLGAEAVEAGELFIRAGVADVRARILDYAGANPLTGALATLTVASYRQDSVTNEEGLASFPDAPLATGTITIHYQGVKVYSSPITYSPEQRLIEIRNTGVYTMTFKILDGEGAPLTGAEFKLSVGTLSVAETLREGSELTLKFIPNGTLSLSVNYLGVNVYTSSYRPLRDGDIVEIVGKVYRLQVEVYAMGMEGRELLRGAQLLFEMEDRSLAEASADTGSAALRLPAGDYVVRVSYKGVPVADRLVTLTGTQKIVIEAAVYEFALKVFRLDGNPAANLIVRLLREGTDEPIEELQTDSEGAASTIIPGGVYNIVYGSGDAINTVKIPVKSASSQTLLYGEARSNSLYPLIAAPVLVALSIYGLYNSFRVKSRARPPSTQPRERRGASEWVRRSRERLRKNV